MNLPPTPLLAGAGAGVGAGLGRGLGQLLDSPRQALTNMLITPWAYQGVMGANQGSAPEGAGGDFVSQHLDDPDSYNPLLAAIPGMVGAGVGMASMMLPGAAPFAGMAGAGAAGLTQTLMGMVAPEKMSAPTTDQLVRALGQDPDTGAGSMLSLGLGAATDPMTWAGGLGGGAAGMEVGAARDGLLSRAAQAGAAGEKVQRLEQMQSLAEQAVQRFEGNVPNPGVSSLLESLGVPPANYRPEVTEALPSVFNAPKVPKVYKQVDPGLAEDMGYMGLAQPTPEGSMLSAGVPDFAQSRGGWLKPTDARQRMLAGEAPAEGTVPMPQVQGPNLDRSQGPMSVLEDPVGDYRRMAGQAQGLSGRPNQVRGRVPTLAQQLGDQAGTQLYDDPLGRISDFPVEDPFGGSRLRQGHVAHLPLYDARDKISQMLTQAQDAQQQMASQPLSPLQQLLQRAGLAPGLPGQ